LRGDEPIRSPLRESKPTRSDSKGPEKDEVTLEALPNKMGALERLKGRAIDNCPAQIEYEKPRP